MKTVISYFSGTGNSLAVARDLAAQVPGAQIVPLADPVLRERCSDADCLGIIFPVYIFGMPLLVRDFLERVRIKTGAYVFSVATYAGLAGDPLGQVVRLLTHSGSRLSAGFLVRMPSNAITLYEPLCPDAQQGVLAAAQKKFDGIARQINARKVLAAERPVFFLRPVFHYAYRLFIKYLPASDAHFWVNASCRSCGFCADICPVENITLEDGKPVWHHHCQHCLACLQWCPHEAIEYGQRTAGRRRYRNPTVRREDLRLQHRSPGRS